MKIKRKVIADHMLLPRLYGDLQYFVRSICLQCFYSFGWQCSMANVMADKTMWPLPTNESLIFTKNRLESFHYGLYQSNWHFNVLDDGFWEGLT